MRNIFFAITMCLASACGPSPTKAYALRYAVAPRAMVWSALETARALHYSVVAMESPDVNHNVFLAFGDGSPSRAPTALLVEISTHEGTLTRCNQDPRAPGCHAAKSTIVAVEPMAFRNGKAVRSADVPEQTRRAAERLAAAIDQRNRGDRRF